MIDNTINELEEIYKLILDYKNDQNNTDLYNKAKNKILETINKYPKYDSFFMRSNLITVLDYQTTVDQAINIIKRMLKDLYLSKELIIEENPLYEELYSTYNYISYLRNHIKEYNENDDYYKELLRVLDNLKRDHDNKRYISVAGNIQDVLRRDINKLKEKDDSNELLLAKKLESLMPGIYKGCKSCNHYEVLPLYLPFIEECKKLYEEGKYERVENGAIHFIVDVLGTSWHIYNYHRGLYIGRHEIKFDDYNKQYIYTDDLDDDKYEENYKHIRPGIAFPEDYNSKGREFLKYFEKKKPINISFEINFSADATKNQYDVEFKENNYRKNDYEQAIELIEKACAFVDMYDLEDTDILMNRQVHVKSHEDIIKYVEKEFNISIRKELEDIYKLPNVDDKVKEENFVKVYHK